MTAIHLAQPGVDGSACGLRQSGRRGVIHRVREIGAVTCKRCLSNARDLHRRAAVVPEAGVQRDVIAYLQHDYRVGVVWRMNTGRRRYVAFGVEGQADVWALLRPHGRLLALEVKKRGERADPHQLAWGATVTASGGVYAVVYSVDDARAAVETATATRP